MTLKKYDPHFLTYFLSQHTCDYEIYNAILTYNICTFDSELGFHLILSLLVLKAGSVEICIAMHRHARGSKPIG